MKGMGRRTRYAVETFCRTPAGVRTGRVLEAFSYAEAVTQAGRAARRYAGARVLAFRAEFDDFAEPRVLATYGEVPEWC